MFIIQDKLIFIHNYIIDYNMNIITVLQTFLEVFKLFKRTKNKPIEQLLNLQLDEEVNEGI